MVANERSGGRVLHRVLFTGSARRVIDNLAEHVPDNMVTEKCTPDDMAFAEALETFHPQALVVCLMDETPDMLIVYQMLEGDPQYTNLPLLVVGPAADCDLFKQKVFVPNMEIFPRPLDQAKFMSALTQYVEMTADEPKDNTDNLDKPAAEAPRLTAQQEAQQEAQERIKALTRNSAQQSVAALLAGRESILVVDDDIMMLNVIRTHLADFYEITTVPSGKLALKFLAKKHADLVLLDFLMPDMDGPAVLQEIREHSPKPEIPVVFLTGVSEKEQVMRGLEFRPNGYLLKPVSREALLERVTEVLLETRG